VATQTIDDGAGGINASKAMAGGLAGTLAMTALMYAAPLVGFPPMDLATMLGTLFVSEMNTAFQVGMAIHLVIGSIILALVYAAIYRWLPGEPWVRGATWGFMLFILANAVVTPLMGAIHPMIVSGQMPAPGFFALNMGVLAPIGSLIAHLVYGGILGGVYGHPEPVEELRSTLTS
jgi:hypothetical protein